MVGEELRGKVSPDSAADLINEGRSPVRPTIGGRLETAAPLAWPPHSLEHRLVYKNIGRPGWTNNIDCYLRDGGYEQLKQALTLSRDDIVNKVKNSGLRGRGGAGFSCGLKWSFIKPD